MYQHAITRISKSIFPVFYRLIRGRETQIGVSGTAFFITSEGHFITANHVTTDIPAGARLIYGGNVPFTPISQPVEIEEVYRISESDIFIGRVQQGTLSAISFAHENPKPGKSLCLSGYPLPQLSLNPDGSINVSNVRQYWQPTFVIDFIKASIEHRQYIGFITQHASLRGMSGGPVFDIEGVVYGMDVATWKRKIPEPDGSETIIENGLVLGVERIREVINERIQMKV
jgi:S1-C subfamily serine protease